MFVLSDAFALLAVINIAANGGLKLKLLVSFYVKKDKKAEEYSFRKPKIPSKAHEH